MSYPAVGLWEEALGEEGTHADCINAANRSEQKRAGWSWTTGLHLCDTRVFVSGESMAAGFVCPAPLRAPRRMSSSLRPL